jgi:hypothetical protein
LNARIHKEQMEKDIHLGANGVNKINIGII